MVCRMFRHDGPCPEILEKAPLIYSIIRFMRPFSSEMEVISRPERENP